MFLASLNCTKGQTCPTMKVKSVRKRWHMESKIEGEGEVAKGGEDVTAAT